MGMLWWLAQEFWPVIAAGVGALAMWLGVKGYGEAKAKQATQQQEIKGAQTRRAVDDAVARTPDDERTRELQSWER